MTIDKTTLRIATRQSPLALWQAEHVQAQLQRLHPDLNIVLVPMSTRGDEILDKSLAKIGGKGLFIKELEVAMHEQEADLAVHSMKDVPYQLPEGFVLSSIMAREDPTDALVCHQVQSFDQLPQGAIVGTSSLRRQSQLLSHRPDLNVKPLRGNVGTRLSKLDSGEYDAIILASAGLKRLGKTDRITQVLSPTQSLPAAGQGAIGIECLASDTHTQQLLTVLADSQTTACVRAERAVTRELSASCTSPLAVYATCKDGIITLRARIGDPDGSRLIEALTSGPIETADSIGVRAAERLRALGAAAYLE